MYRRFLAQFGILLIATLSTAGSVTAQTIPMHSGASSHGEPQMRAKGSGLYYPNRPHYHHQYGFAGYQDIYGTDNPNRRP